MAQLLGQVNPGTIVKLNENGQPVEFYVAAQDYESGLNGQGRVLLVRKNAYQAQVWNSSNVNTYDNSTIDTWLNNTYKNYLDPVIKNLTSTTVFYYTLGNGNNTVSTLERSIFILSFQELGKSNPSATYEGKELPITSTLTSLVENQWTRTPVKSEAISVWYIYSNGSIQNAPASSNSPYVRPCFTLPSTLSVESDGTITTTFNLSVYTPSLAMQGQPLSIQWSPISNATSYQLQRNTGSAWETVYTGANTSYTDTIGTWTTVQYQVAVDIGGGYGAYTQSTSIPVVSASSLVISGQDGSLGTITADIPYTVTSDTGNPISIVRTVNGVQYASTTVESGFAYNIPVMELPTGEGTIVITASVQSTSGLVTVTRTWTYNKTPINFSNSGSVASLAINGENILPTTLSEAVRTSPVWGGSLDLALQKLSNAAFYETVTPTAQLGTLAEGSIIYLNESGSPVPFYVAKQGYEPTYNTDRVLVVRKEAVTTGLWNNAAQNQYNSSAIDNYCNTTYLQTLDNSVQNDIGTTVIQYTPMNGNTSISTIEKSVFILSCKELAKTPSGANEEGNILPIAEELQTVNYNGVATHQWTRTPYISNNSNVFYVLSSNSSTNNVAANFSSLAYRPAFTLPTTFIAYTTLPTTGLYDLSDNLLLTLPGVQIETGSYVGTGTYGSGNPNTLTFGFVPKLLMIQPAGYGINRMLLAPLPKPNNVQSIYDYNTSLGTIILNWNENTVTWYGNTASGQLNEGVAYYYIAIG